MKVRQKLQCLLAEREFFEFCKVMHPKFYKDERTYLKDMCEGLQEFYYNDQEFMLINLPP